MSSTVQPEGDGGFRCLCSQQRAAGCASLPCFEVRFSASSRQTIYLCNTCAQAGVATSDIGLIRDKFTTDPINVTQDQFGALMISLLFPFSWRLK